MSIGGSTMELNLTDGNRSRLLLPVSSVFSAIVALISSSWLRLHSSRTVMNRHLIMSYMYVHTKKFEERRYVLM